MKLRIVAGVTLVGLGTVGLIVGIWMDVDNVNEHFAAQNQRDAELEACVRNPDCDWQRMERLHKMDPLPSASSPGLIFWGLGFALVAGAGITISAEPWRKTA